jgi:hypothetical protein
VEDFTAMEGQLSRPQAVLALVIADDAEGERHIRVFNSWARETWRSAFDLVLQVSEKGSFGIVEDQYLIFSSESLRELADELERLTEEQVVSTLRLELDIGSVSEEDSSEQDG